MLVMHIAIIKPSEESNRTIVLVYSIRKGRNCSAERQVESLFFI